jgi:hypothetical protein
LANLYVVWNIKERRAESIHESSSDANVALRQFVEKSGSKANDKVSGASATGLEVLTVTR